MSHGERLARLIHALCWIGIALAAVTLARDAARGTLPFADRVDPDTRTAGLLVEIDAATGCQYLVTPWGGIVPRTGPDGRQLCAAHR